MRDYLKGSQCLLCHNPRNLFTLRLDLLLGQFDEANFVIVPKLGQLVVHFFQPNQSAKHYHNTPFGHNHALSHELLYARFAWSLMKIVKHSLESIKRFKFLGTPETDGGGDEDGGGGRGGRRRSGGQGRGRGRYSRGINKGTRSGLRKRKGEAQILDTDMKKAACTLPFFCKYLHMSNACKTALTESRDFHHSGSEWTGGPLAL